MRNQSKDKHRIGDKALELLMRDVMDGMQDLALGQIYEFRSEDCAVTAISEPLAVRDGRGSNVLSMLARKPKRHNQNPDIVAYLTAREIIAQGN